MEWNILYIKQGSGQRLAELLSRKKIQNFFPLGKVTVEYGSTKKIIQKPVFPTYIFVRVAEKELSELKKLNSAINLVYWLGKPAAITNADVIAIRYFLSNYTDIIAQKIVVDNGTSNFTLAAENTSSSRNVAQLILPCLGYALSAEVLPSNVRYISSNKQVGNTKIIQKKLSDSVQNYFSSLLQ